jgi:catechol 2,3-dioxygenase-like lactoylglutathione lyase family enzyme
MNPSLLHGTVTVPDLDAALLLYRDLFEQRLIDVSPIGSAEAAAWGASALVGARSAVLQPPSGAPVYVRLIEQPPTPGHQPGRHTGWAALELSVKDADALHARLVEKGYEIIAAPRPLSFTDKLYPMQARGPGGETLYLNEVRGSLPNTDLPVAQCWVDRLFIAVMGCRERTRALDFYNALLGTATGGTYEIDYQVVNRAFGLPQGTITALSTVADGRCVLFEVDQYPAAATPKPTQPGRLPPGVALIGVAADRPPKGAYWRSAPAPRRHAPYFGAAVGVLDGPDGELTELVRPI